MKNKMNNLDSPEGLYCYNLIQEAVPFDEKWYDMSIDKVKEIISENSENDFVFIQFDYKQLGHGEKWLTKQKRLVGNDLLTIKREILLEWTLAGDTSPFSEEQLASIEHYIKKPIGSFYIKDLYKFNILDELHNIRERNYIISIDIAGGLEKDATAITIIDPLTYKPVVEFKSNRIDTPTLVEVIVELVEMYFNEAVIVPERNNMGLSVIQMLLKTSVARNMYYEKKQRTTEKEVGLRGKTKKSNKELRIYGIDTTAKSREIMIKEILNMVVNERPEMIISDSIFKEIKTLERKKNGKIEHRDGCHDDCLMSYLIGLYMILYGLNAGKFIKISHTGKFNEEQVETDNSKQRVIKNIATVQRITTDNPNMKKLDEFLKSYEKMNIDTTNHGTIVGNSRKTIKSSKVTRNIGFLSSLNK